MGYGKHLNKTTFKHLEQSPESFKSLEGYKVHNQEQACQALKAQFDRLELSLAKSDATPDIGSLQKILVDINQLVQSESNPLLEDGYNRLLNRLIKIYTRSITRHDSEALTATAVNYADVIEAISQAHPHYDYSEAVGHLLHYMNRLYLLRERSWLNIFEHLVSMPDSIHVIQLLKNRHLNEIQQWIEEGVHNLFQLRDDQLHVITEMIAKLRVQEDRIASLHKLLEQYHQAKVIPISVVEQRQELESLLATRDWLLTELENKNRLVDLLDENIGEFGEKLSETRRACLIHLI